MNSLFDISNLNIYYFSRFIAAYVVLAVIAVMLKRIFPETKILNYFKDKPSLFFLCSIPFTYLFYGIVYVEDLIFSTVAVKEFLFTGCSGIMELSPGLKKCFYLIPSNIPEVGLMLGKLMSSFVFFIIFYFFYIKNRKMD
jgi:hypothetical protein|tara:strand:- start:948 stop:1367 length:420 start_codon:yes stop_codon:yes gene_type:complete